MSRLYKLLLKPIALQSGKKADMSGLLKFVGQNLAIPNQSIIDAVKCLRIEGMKTALLTNNWKWDDRESDWNMPRYIIKD